MLATLCTGINSIDPEDAFDTVALNGAEFLAQTTTL
jgi:hypothetical protein